MVAPIQVKVTDKRVEISEAEYTSEGFETDGLNPFTTYPAGIACYYTGQSPSRGQYPHFIFSGSYPQPFRTEYDGKTAPYSPLINRSPMVNNTAGSVIGYKYYNFSLSRHKKQLTFCLHLIPQGVDGHIDIYVDAPDEERGGRKVGRIILSKFLPNVETKMCIPVPEIAELNGKHALYLVFDSREKDKTICEIESLHFEVR